MPEFNPEPNQIVTIGGQQYSVMPHPAVPVFAFGQEGRKAMVFQLGLPSGEKFALKKFKEVYRLPELVDVNDALARFSQWPGMEVCNRQCFQYGLHDDILAEHPDLEYAVLMPWIMGTTWYDVVIGEKPLDRSESLSYASAVARVLAAIEEAGLAHCDISAANVIINPTTERAHLIDVEDLYAPGFEPPANLPAGTDGYAHISAKDGLWEPAADRFSGAILISEMIAWHSAEVRKQAEEEHFFPARELQDEGPHYDLMIDVLNGIDQRLTELFNQAWYSQTLADAPRLAEWYDVLQEAYHTEKVSKYVSGWNPIIPGGTASVAEPEPQVQPARPTSQPEPVQAQPAPSPVDKDEDDEAQVQQPAAQQPAASVSQTPAIQPSGQPIIQPPSVPSQPPTTRPVTITQDNTPGGPVKEWRPIGAPAPTEQESGQGSAHPVEMRPIQMTPAVASNGGSSGYTPLVQAEEDEDDTEEGLFFEEESVLADDELELYESAGDDDADPKDDSSRDDDLNLDIYEDEEFQEWVAGPVGEYEQPESIYGLLKPILDLSHIDKRGRPHLVWTESPLAEWYVLEESGDPNFGKSKTFKLKSDDTRWHPRMGRSGRLFYRIRSEAGSEVSEWSETLSLRIGEG